MIDSVYQNYTLMNTYEHWRHMFCTNVYLTTKVFNLENDEIKRVLVMLVASYFLNKVTYSLYLGNLLRGYVSFRILRYHTIFIKFQFLIFPFVTPT